MNNFIRNFISVFLGSVASQIIPITGMLFLARIYSPSTFGAFTAWISIVTFAAVVLTLRLENALPIIMDRLERFKAVCAVVIITFLVSIFFMILLSILEFNNLISPYLNNIPIYIYLISPCALFVSLNIVMQNWAAIEGDYKVLNIMRVMQSSFVIGLQIIFGSLNASSSSLIFSFILANITASIISAVLMRNYYYKENIRFSEIKEFIKRFKKLSLFALPADSMNTLVGQLPVLIVSYRFGSDVAGFLGLTMRILAAPVGLIGKAVLDVFKRHAAIDLKEKGNCKNVYWTAFAFLGLISILMSLVIILFSEEVFMIAFGNDWRLSGTMALWLLPMFAFGLVASPLSYLAYLVEKNHIDLYWQLGLFIMCCVTLSIFQNYKETLIAYAIGYSLMYTLYIYISHQFSKG